MTQRVAVALRMSLMVVCAMAAMVTAPARAEKADREKPINFSAEQPAEVDFEKRVGTLRGNVVITQGTLTIRADRIDFKQNADNSLSATAYGNPVSFRQKKDDSDEYFEGYAQRAVYDGQKQTARAVRSRAAEAGQATRYAAITFRTTARRASSRPRAARTHRASRGRARGCAACSSRARTRRSSPKGRSKGDANGVAMRGAGKEAPAPAKGGQAAPAAKSAPPLKLTPDASLPAK